MKFILVPVILVILISFSARGQDDAAFVDRGSKNPGYIVTLEGDTVKGYTLNFNLWTNQMVTLFFRDMDEGKKGQKYRARDLLGYKTGPRVYERLEYEGMYSPYKYNFFLKKIDGDIDLFVWYYSQDIDHLGGTNVLLTQPSDAFLIDENDLWPEMIGRTASGELIEFGSHKFKSKFAKMMSVLVSDDSELAGKISRKEEGYQYRDLEKILLEYNRWKAIH